MSFLANYRQRSASEIIDASFTLYRANFALFALIALSVAMPPAILLTFVPVRSLPVNIFVGGIFLPLGTGIIAALVFADLSGAPVSLHEVLSRLGRKFGTMLIYQWASGVMVLLGLIMLILPGIYFFIWTAVGIPVIAIEGADFGDAFSRAKDLSDDHGGHVFATITLVNILNTLLSGSAGFVIGWAAGPMGMGVRVAMLLAKVLGSLFIPPVAIAVALLYIDLRVRTEGLDIDALSAALPPVAVSSLPVTYTPNEAQ